MPVPAFGWSVGDIAVSIKILSKVAKSLKQSGGATEQYQDALSFLECVRTTREHLDRYAANCQDQAYSPAIEKCIRTIEKPLVSFSDFLHRFEKSLSESSTRSKAYKAPRKAQWAIKELDGEIEKMMTAVVRPQSIINTLLTLQILDMPQHMTDENIQTLVDAMKAAFSPDPAGLSVPAQAANEQTAHHSLQIHYFQELREILNVNRSMLEAIANRPLNERSVDPEHEFQNFSIEESQWKDIVSMKQKLEELQIATLSMQGHKHNQTHEQETLSNMALSSTSIFAGLAVAFLAGFASPRRMSGTAFSKFSSYNGWPQQLPLDLLIPRSNAYATYEFPCKVFGCTVEPFSSVTELQNHVETAHRSTGHDFYSCKVVTPTNDSLTRTQAGIMLSDVPKSLSPAEPQGQMALDSAFASMSISEGNSGSLSSGPFQDHVDFASIQLNALARPTTSGFESESISKTQKHARSAKLSDLNAEEDENQESTSKSLPFFEEERSELDLGPQSMPLPPTIGGTSSQDNETVQKKEIRNTKKVQEGNGGEPGDAYEYGGCDLPSFSRRWASEEPESGILYVRIGAYRTDYEDYGEQGSLSMSDSLSPRLGGCGPRSMLVEEDHFSSVNGGWRTPDMHTQHPRLM